MSETSVKRAGARRGRGAEDAALARYQRLRRGGVALICVALGVVMAFGRSSLPMDLHERVEEVGIMLITTAIAGRLWATLYIGGRKSVDLVDTGPYSITRNPLYLFSALAAAGVGAQLGSVTAALGFGCLCAGVFGVVIRREERFLSERLGAPFADYRARVPRFWPNLARFRDQDEVTFRPKLLAGTLRDGLLFFLAMPLFETIEHAQNTGALPVLFRMW